MRISLLTLAILFSLALAAPLSAAARAADYSYTMTIDGIAGDAANGAIAVQSYSIGETNAGSSGSGGAGAGKVTFSDFSFVAPTDKAAPALFLGCAAGRHFAKAVFVVRKNGQEFIKITLSDVLITSYQTVGQAGADGLPVQSISLGFATIEYTYQTSSTGSGGGTTPGTVIGGGWDIKANKKI